MSVLAPTLHVVLHPPPLLRFLIIFRSHALGAIQNRSSFEGSAVVSSSTPVACSFLAEMFHLYVLDGTKSNLFAWRAFVQREMNPRHHKLHCACFHKAVASNVCAHLTLHVCNCIVLCLHRQCSLICLLLPVVVSSSSLRRTVSTVVSRALFLDHTIKPLFCNGKVQADTISWTLPSGAPHV